jgi:zinc transporter ZupT
MLMTAILLRTTFATLVAFAGGALGVALGSAAARRIQVLVFGAMGVLLAVTVCDVLPDAKEILNWPQLVLSAASGYALFWVIGKYVYHLCPSCAFSAFDEATTQRLSQTVVLLMVALGIHSAMDGLAVVVGDRVLGRPNLGVLFAVSFHKLPEGLALALLLLGAGYGRRQAFLWTVAIEATTELGGLIGLFALRDVSLHWLGLIFGHVGGGFLYLVASTLGVFRKSLGGQGRGSLPSRPLVVSSSLGFAVTAVLIWTFSRITH